MKTLNDGAKILVVDDSINTLELLYRNLVLKGYQVFTAASVSEAIQVTETTAIDLVITDLKMPGIDGMDLIKHVRENLKNTQVIMITGYASIESAVAAVKCGAEAYLAKPFTDDELFSAVRRTLEKIPDRKQGPAPAPDAIEKFGGLVGKSAEMKNIFSEIRKAASVSATVLITGESGTGKELVARAIHYHSQVASAPFVPVNCGGIPEGLLESELFGCTKGAFTGAVTNRIGFFQAANGGTIFLDEVGNTSPAMQSKLLRVMEDQTIYPVGSSQPITIQVRILAATNKDLMAMVQNGLFREDLFYRLNVLTIHLPPLRKRQDDIGVLTNLFTQKYARLFNKSISEFSDHVLEVMENYHWPGNVRELENLVQRLVAMSSEGQINISDLPPAMRFSISKDRRAERTLAEVEAEHIRNVLAHTHGNKTQAAKILGIDRKTLRKKAQDLGLDR